MKGTFTIFINGYDYGCAVTKATVKLDGVLDAVTKNDITVTEHKQVTDFSKFPEFPVIEADFPRTILDAYLADEAGNRTEKASDTVVIEMDESPAEGSPLLFSMHTMFNTWSVPYELHIEAAEGAKLTSEGKAVDTLEIDPCDTGRTTCVDEYKLDSFTASNGTTMKYACWSPEGGSKNLMIWLHGIGEGGVKDTDPRVTLLANKDSVFSKEAFQKTVGGANVLIPQCPTYWMDGDGTGGNHTAGHIEATEVSFYTEALHELILAYKEQTGSEKLVVSGCSNGGYMTVVMAMNYPDLFDAIVPVCEAVPNKCISDDAVNTLKDIPSYYIWSDDDKTVIPELHEVPLIERMKKAGTKDLHVSTTEHVTDTSGKYKMPDGTPYLYNGHWSWIYLFNNECDADGKKAWDFIADYLK